MAAESIGQLIPTKIPGYSDAADIQETLRLYHYGSYDYDVNNTDTAQLVSPSIAHTLNSLQTQISGITAISPNVFNAKGDLLSASADNTPLIIGVGSTGQILSANPATATGLQWISPEVTLSNTATLLNKTLVAPIITTSFNQQTSTAYTLVLSDSNKVIELNSSSAITLTVPLDSSVNFATGVQLNILQTGTGQVTVVGASGVTVNGTPGLKLRTQWSSGTLVKRSNNTWILVGDIVA